MAIIITAMAKNTTTEPRTQSAGLAMKSFSKIVVFIFSIEKKEKTSHRPIANERFIRHN